MSLRYVLFCLYIWNRKCRNKMTQYKRKRHTTALVLSKKRNIKFAHFGNKMVMANNLQNIHRMSSESMVTEICLQISASIPFRGRGSHLQLLLSACPQKISEKLSVGESNQQEKTNMQIY
mmetsp:Transcript_38523/g.50786  ORF Transcript_38523/g.50786 Transcript_38523/m.50786 type:complete len:120 (-) Transcript_38523:6-365(-)